MVYLNILVCFGLFFSSTPPSSIHRRRFVVCLFWIFGELLQGRLYLTALIPAIAARIGCLYMHALGCVLCVYSVCVYIYNTFINVCNYNGQRKYEDNAI